MFFAHLYRFLLTVLILHVDFVPENTSKPLSSIINQHYGQLINEQAYRTIGYSVLRLCSTRMYVR